MGGFLSGAGPRGRGLRGARRALRLGPRLEPRPAPGDRGGGSRRRPRHRAHGRDAHVPVAGGAGEPVPAPPGRRRDVRDPVVSHAPRRQARGALRSRKAISRSSMRWTRTTSAAAAAARPPRSPRSRGASSASASRATSSIPRRRCAAGLAPRAPSSERSSRRTATTRSFWRPMPWEEPSPTCSNPRESVSPADGGGGSGTGVFFFGGRAVMRSPVPDMPVLPALARSPLSTAGPRWNGEGSPIVRISSSSSFRTGRARGSGFSPPIGRGSE